MRRWLSFLRPTAGTAEAPRFPPPRGSGLDLVVLALIVAPLAWGAWHAFPTWDDGTIYFWVDELGPQAIRDGMGDRPLAGWIWAALAEHGVLWQAMGALYLASWLGTGIIAMHLWRLLFPSRASLAAAVCCLAVGPVLCETQLIVGSVIMNAHLPVVVPYGALLLVRAAEGRGGRRLVASRLVAAPIVFVAALSSEYALLSVAALSIVLYGLSLADPDQARRRRSRTSLAWLGAAALAGYLVLLAISAPEVRPELRPASQLSAEGVRRLAEVPLRLPFSFWTAALGQFLEKLGSISLWSGSMWGLPYGFVVAVLVHRAVRRTGGDAGGPTATEDWRRAVFVALAVVIVLVPIIAMISPPRRALGSRLWLPVLPLAVCLTLFILMTVIQPRIRVACAVACGFLAGYGAMNAAVTARNIHAQTVDLGAKLHRELSPVGLTAAVFSDFPTNPYVGAPVARPSELIARLTWDWPDADRRRFWAGVYTWPDLRGQFPGMNGLCAPQRWLDSESRGWKRRGRVEKLVWVSLTPNNELLIEPDRATPPCPSP